jgi:hypothetical protein
MTLYEVSDALRWSACLRAPRRTRLLGTVNWYLTCGIGGTGRRRHLSMCARTRAQSPGGQPGNHSAARAACSHPEHRLFGQATPGPATHPTTPTAPFPAPLPSVRAGGRVKDRAQPGRAAAPAGRPRRGRARADNARSGKGGSAAAADSRQLLHRITASPLTLKQRGVRSVRLAAARCRTALAPRSGHSVCRAGVRKCLA